MRCTSIHLSRLAVGLFSLVAPAPTVAASQIPTPSSAFRFDPGEDRKLVDYEQLIAYMQELASASPRIEMKQIGRSPEGRPVFVAFISSPENIARLDQLRTINRRLALDPAIPEKERGELVANGRVFLMLTLSMHSSEVGPSQALPLYAYELAVANDPEVIAQLDNVVLMVVPCHNPDGMDKVVSYYRKTVGGPYEGGAMPGVYHRYVGHDNNRDFVALTQADTRAIARLYSTEWYPQMLVEKHQMGTTSPRYFLPPNHDPIAVNVDEGLWAWSAMIGSAVARDMTRDGLRGITQHWVFDNYWPGSTETSLWKGVITLLTEAASAKVATPVWIERNEMRPGGKGLAEYEKSVNMPDPWPGGWWRLGDIVGYELSSFRSLLRVAASNKKAILEFRNDLTRDEIRKGESEPPFYFVLPKAQHDGGGLGDLVALLLEHGIRVGRLTDGVTVAGRSFEAGSIVVPLAQPYRAFVKEIMEPQRYPVRHYSPGGEVIMPYDITSWSLPLHWGLESHEIDVRSPELESKTRMLTTAPTPPALTLPKNATSVALSSTDNRAYRAAFSALNEGLTVRRITAALTVGDETLPAGSFLVSGKRKALEAVAEIAPAAAVAITRVDEPKAERVGKRRIALVESWHHDMDAGWTRFVLDTYGVPYHVLRPGDVAGVDLAGDFDLVLFPDEDSHVIKEGRLKEDARYAYDLPPEFAQGLGKKGMKRVVSFLDAGGIIVAWRRSTALFTEAIEIERDEDTKERIRLPVSDVAEEAEKKGLVVPGALLNVTLRPDHPLTWGLPPEIDVFARSSPVLRTAVPVFDMDRRVLASYPKEDVLASGFIQAPEQIAQSPAVVWVRKGRGQLVLFGFHPHFRASTPGTFRFLFNALLLPAIASD